MKTIKVQGLPNMMFCPKCNHIYNNLEECPCDKGDNK